VWGHGFSEAGTRKSFFRPGFRGRGFSEVVTRKSFLGPDSGNSNILLLLFSCTNKRTCGDMQDR
jgi:hypothetical protein